MADSLRKEAYSGMGWSFFDNILRLGISFVVGIVLARLLTPSIYGTIGIVTIFTSLFNSFVDCGLSTALIRKKDATDADFSTIFIANLTIASFLYLALFIGAPLIADFFKIDELTQLLRVVGITIIISSLSLVQLTVLTKRIDFKTQTKTTFIASVVSGAVGILMAYLGFGVWALVAQLVLSALVKTIALWIFNRWFPSLKFSYKSFREMFGFGWKLMLIGLMNAFWMNIYNFVIGKFYTQQSLGLYNRAKQFSDLCSSNITNVVQSVSLPLLSKIQDDSERIKYIYRKTIKLTAFVTFVLLFGLSGVSHTFIYVLLGEKWLGAADYLPLVAFSMILYPIGLINLNLIAIKGRSDLCLKIEVIKKILAIIPILFGIICSIKYMLIASIVINYVSYYLNAYYSNTLIGYSLMLQIKDIKGSLFLSLSMYLILLAIGMFEISPYYLLAIQVLFAICYIITVSKYSKMEEFKDISNLVCSFLAKFKK